MKEDVALRLRYVTHIAGGRVDSLVSDQVGGAFIIPPLVSLDPTSSKSQMQERRREEFWREEFTARRRRCFLDQGYLEEIGIFSSIRPTTFILRVRELPQEEGDDCVGAERSVFPGSLLLARGNDELSGGCGCRSE